jgi:thiol-disulfide isomerase/thioredoxin
MESSLIYGMGFIMIAVGAGFLWILLKDNEAKRPKDAMEWFGIILSSLLIISAVSLMLLARGTEQAIAESGQRVATEAVFQDATIEVEAENFSFSGVHDDVTTSLEDFEGRVVIINFWATWCGPCLEEIPALNRLQREFENDGLVILSISDEDPLLLQSFERRLPLDTHSMYVSFGTELPLPFTGAFVIRPASFIVDRDGVVRRYLLGARSYDFFKKAIQPLL